MFFKFGTLVHVIRECKQDNAIALLILYILKKISELNNKNISETYFYLVVKF